MEARDEAGILAKRSNQTADKNASAETNCETGDDSVPRGKDCLVGTICLLLDTRWIPLAGRRDGVMAVFFSRGPPPTSRFVPINRPKDRREFCLFRV